MQQLRRQHGLPVPETSHHLVFTGNPGTGKTTVARLVAQIYRTLGVVERGQLVESGRSDLVAGYMGQTAARTTSVFDSASGGVLLIDEAYALNQGNEDEFGREAVNTLVKLIEDRRDEVVVVVAGYPGEMDEFLDANPGLRSRFPRTIHFPDYSTDELVEILDSLCQDSTYRLTPEARAPPGSIFDAEPRGKGFGNGRMARNLFEAALERQAGRIVAIADPTEDVCQLTDADIADHLRGPGAAGPRRVGAGDTDHRCGGRRDPGHTSYGSTWDIAAHPDGSVEVGGPATSGGGRRLYHGMYYIPGAGHVDYPLGKQLFEDPRNGSLGYVAHSDFNGSLHEPDVGLIATGTKSVPAIVRVGPLGERRRRWVLHRPW